KYGVQVPPGTTVNFRAVMERMRRLRASISPNDSAARYRALGVDVYFGQARFTGPDSVEVGGRTLRFRKAVIATGSRAAPPPISGLAEAGYVTNETVFSLSKLPRRLGGIRAGPIGCEPAPAVVRLGAGCNPAWQPRPNPSERGSGRRQTGRSRDGARRRQAGSGLQRDARPSGRLGESSSP